MESLQIICTPSIYGGPGFVGKRAHKIILVAMVTNYTTPAYFWQLTFLQGYHGTYHRMQIWFHGCSNAQPHFPGVFLPTEGDGAGVVMISGTLAKSTLAAFRIAPPESAAGARLGNLGLVPVEKVACLLSLLISTLL